MDRKLRIGFIGCGWIADWACTGFKDITNAEPSAIFARNKERMKKFSEKYSIPFYTDSMEEFLKKENGHGVHMDAVYVATTNETHYSMAKKAMEAGFPVFLEKPVTVSAAQAHELKRISEEQGVFLMEGMWTRFLPASMLVKEKIQAGVIGKITDIKAAVYCKMNPVNNARVFKMETGGGVLADVGIYAISMIRYLTGVSPDKIENKINFYETGIDQSEEVTYTYHESAYVKEGTKASFLVESADWGNPEMVITGEKGTIVIDNLTEMQQFRIKTEGHDRLIRVNNGRWRFTYQIEHFADCIEAGEKESWVMPFSESCEIMETLEETLKAGGMVYPENLTRI